MAKTKESRNIKVYGKYFSRDNSYRPQIRLEGLWLSESGFEVGDHLSVICEDGKLVINRYNDDTDGAA